VTLKNEEKERQQGLCEDQDQLIRTLQEQSTKMLLYAHIISIEIEQLPEENG
jgi:hypothetical protein